MSGPPATVRLLMCGRDKALLDIRAKVLHTRGWRTELAETPIELQQRLAADSARPALVLICHTSDDGLAHQARRSALEMGIATYAVDRLVPPVKLLQDVQKLLDRGRRTR